MTSVAPYADHDTKVGGLKLHYQEWGDPKSPPILMLHGFGVSGHMFDEFADRVKDRYRLIALDQRGHGDSEWSEPGDYTREAFVKDVEGFRKALKLDRFILVGHSMGGLNAVSYTAEHPEHVSALILVDVGPEAAKEGVDNIVRFTQGPDELEFEEFVELAHRFNQRRTIENIRERMRHRLKQSESGKYTWKFDKRFRQPDTPLKIGSDLTNDQVWQLYRDITVPTLLVRGAESDVLTPETAERAIREMRRARLRVVPGAGHSVPGDNPDDFSAAVTEFLSDVEQKRFDPEVAVDLPPLEQLVTEADRRRKGSAGPGALIAIAAGAVIAVGIGVWILKTAFGSKKQDEPKASKAKGKRRGKPEHHSMADDVAATAARMADLATTLGEAGARGASRAATAIKEADLASAVAPVVDAAQPVVAAAEPAVSKALDKARHSKALEKVRPAKKKRSRIGTAMKIARYGYAGARIIGEARKRRRSHTARRRRGMLRR